MKTYLEIQVPIKYDDCWFKELRQSFDGMPVRWQQGYYHITMAFCDETPEDIDLPSILDKHFADFEAPAFEFEKIDAFTANNGMTIVYLGMNDIPTEFLSKVDNIRKDLKAAGCNIESDFLLHVTLGRIADSSLSLASIKSITDSFSLPLISLQLTDIEHRVFRGRTLYHKQLQ